MTIALGVCSKDYEIAIKLIKWIRKLNDNKPLPHRSLLVMAGELVPKDRGTLIKEMRRAFSTVSSTFLIHAVAKWPEAPNEMLKAALEWGEQLQDDILWLESDSIPVKSDWVEQISKAWRERKPHQHFMGNLVEYHWNHMTGVGVYGRHWRRYAPKLLQATTMAWDVFAADQVLPRARFTPLIQHVFWLDEIKDLSVLDPKAVIFHQDKKGRLIDLLSRPQNAGRTGRTS